MEKKVPIVLPKNYIREILKYVAIRNTGTTGILSAADRDLENFAARA